MQSTPELGIAIGLAIFCVGGFARIKMDYAANGMRMFHDFRRGNTEKSYWKLIKEHRAPAWPFILSIVCVSLGAVILFGSIIWSNHLKH